MNPSLFIYAIIVFFIAYLTGYLINLKYKVGIEGNRFESIDGLRGLLATSVFVCHTNVWYTYLHNGVWEAPNSALFRQFGDMGVTFFFMISSFLFINKLLEHKKTHFNWKQFFVKRILRLAPLHFFITFLIVTIAFIQSNLQLQVSFAEFAKNIAKWLGFGILGFGEINAENASVINAGVLWSLPYEWLLYFSLPLLTIFIRRIKTNFLYVLLSLFYLGVITQFRVYETHHLLSFLGGAIAPLIMKFRKTKAKVNTPLFSTLVLISIVILFQLEDSSSIFCKLLATIPFTLIALGNPIYGFLKSSTLKFLSEISYGTYLLHGVVIFVAVHYIYGVQSTLLLSESSYSLLMFLITPFVIVLSFITYHFIEKPFMRLGKKIGKK